MINEVMREIAWKTFKVVIVLLIICIIIGILIGKLIL